MSYYVWDVLDDMVSGRPYPVVIVQNIHVAPMGDGLLRLVLVDHPRHGAAWDAVEEHGLGGEVALILDSARYCYYADLGDEEDDTVYLVPIEDANESGLPDNHRLMETAVHLLMRW